jgi:hypothetical protein
VASEPQASQDQGVGTTPPGAGLTVEELEEERAMRAQLAAYDALRAVEEQSGLWLGVDADGHAYFIDEFEGPEKPATPRMIHQAVKRADRAIRPWRRELRTVESRRLSRRSPRARGGGRPAGRARTVRGDGGDGDGSASAGPGEPGDSDKPPDVGHEPGTARAFRRARAP